MELLLRTALKLKNQNKEKFLPVSVLFFYHVINYKNCIMSPLIDSIIPFGQLPVNVELLSNNHFSLFL